jgi:hypothetical protein
VKLFVEKYLEFLESTEPLIECLDLRAIDMFDIKQEGAGDETKGSSDRK